MNENLGKLILIIIKNYYKQEWKEIMNDIATGKDASRKLAKRWSTTKKSLTMNLHC